MALFAKLASETSETINEFVDQRIPDAKLDERTLSRLAWLYAGAVPNHLGGRGLSIAQAASEMWHLGFATQDQELVMRVGVHAWAVTSIVGRWGNDDQLQCLPKLMTGEEIAAIAISESGAGSDTAPISAWTTNDGSAVTGEKLYVTNGDVASQFLIAAKMTGKLAFYLAPYNSSTVKLRPYEGGAPITSCLRTVSFERTQTTGRLGGRAEFPFVITAAMAAERLMIFIGLLGVAQASFDQLLAHCVERKQFGRAIFENQAVQYQLVDAKLQLDATAAYCANIVSGSSRFALDKSSAVKLLVSQSLRTVMSLGLELMGAGGSTGLWSQRQADAMAAQTYSGTSNMQREAILPSLHSLKGRK